MFVNTRQRWRLIFNKSLFTFLFQGSYDDNEEDSDDDDASLLNKSSALLQTVVYVVTDIETFQPKKKKPKLCYRTYRLLGLKSTTPDELYARKVIFNLIRIKYNLPD